MALFTRKTPGSAAAAEEAGRTESERRPKTIGELLGDARRHHGATIQAVGAALRIRPVFLQAIEDNRYDRLPGSVYALGFVRTYADYLGLDGEAFARRFKTEVAGLETKQDFSFPMPLPDRGLPGGALLLVALIVAACAYAVWYYRASGERTRPERVAAVPEQLIPLPPAALTPAQDQAAHPAPAEPASQEPTGAPAAVPTPPSASVTASSNSPQTPPAETSTPRLPAVVEPAPPPQTTVSTPPAVPGETATASPPAIPEVSAAPAVPPAPVPRVYGITNGPVRIVIKAAADSWVQVRDANQSVLQMRVLKPGDTLRVPDRAGLTLRTGNAGGLEITVDGKPVPAVGPFGKTRSVALDPERLVAGTSQVE